MFKNFPSTKRFVVPKEISFVLIGFSSASLAVPDGKEKKATQIPYHIMWGELLTVEHSTTHYSVVSFHCEIMGRPKTCK